MTTNEQAQAENITANKALANASARLAAVQALYQSYQTDKSAQQITEEFVQKYLPMVIDGEELAMPDGAMFIKIVKGVMERKVELQTILDANRNNKNDDDLGEKPFEHILNSILLSGTFELLVHDHIDAPIIINDYLNVTHAFYDKREVGLVNGILDSVKNIFRA